MKSKLLKCIAKWIPMLLGIFLVWYSFAKLSSEDVAEIIKSIQEANYFWILLSVLMGFISHLFRALRWKLSLAPLGYKASTKNSLIAVFIGYLVNIVLPRAGEFSRAAAINQTEKIPGDQALGTIISERIIDLFMLGLVIGLAIWVQSAAINEIVQAKIPNQIGPIVWLGIIIIGFGLWFVFKSKNKTILKLRGFIEGVWKGLCSIWKLEYKWAYLFYSLMIWALYIGMFYVATRALSDTENIGLSAVLTGFLAGTFSIAATNGGIGSYPIAIQKSLELYGVPAISGLSFGWIMWSTQTLMMIVLGGLSFLFLKQKN
ncbi:flippase-like domain-containing protein [Flavobacteriaceae bacterium]|nr:flippase-like domain-containing protein [Flavobacteriaceae bacterium]